MEFLALIAIVYFFIGAGVCLLICVNPNDPGILGKLSRFVYRTVPNAFSYAYDSIQIVCQESIRIRSA